MISPFFSGGLSLVRLGIGSLRSTRFGLPKNPSSIEAIVEVMAITISEFAPFDQVFLRLGGRQWFQWFFFG
jgi:hypothetical protein